MSDNEIKLVKLRDPEYSRFADPTQPDYDANDPRGWSLVDVKRRHPSCKRLYDVVAPFRTHGALAGNY